MGRGDSLSSEEWAKWNKEVGIPEEPTEDKGREALEERMGVEKLPEPAREALLKYWAGRSDEVDFGNHFQAARAIEEDLGLVPGSISDDDLRSTQDEIKGVESEAYGIVIPIMGQATGREITARNIVHRKMDSRYPEDVITMILDKYFQIHY